MSVLCRILLFAAANGNKDDIRAAIDAGANINYQDAGPVIPPGECEYISIVLSYYVVLYNCRTILY